MLRIASLLLPVTLACCGPAVMQDSDDAKAAEAADHAGLPVSPVRYFPPASAQPQILCDYGRGLERHPVVDAFLSRWFSQHLLAAEEPSIYLAAERGAPGGASTFRLTWFRTFHGPVFIRLERAADGKHRLIAKELSAAGGYEPGTIKRRIERDLSPEEVRRFQRLLKRTVFFHLSPKHCDLGCDGSEWIFESADQSGYHLLTRWSPDAGPVREVGEFLIGLSGWHFAEVY